MTVAPVPGFADTTPPPRLINTGTDYVAIAKSLDRYHAWLDAHHPDPSLAKNVLVPSSTLYPSFVTELSELQQRHQSLMSVGQRLTFVLVSVHRTLVTLRVHEVIARDEFRDASQNIVRIESYSAPNDYVTVLALGADRRWRIADITQVSVDPAVVVAP